MPMGKYSGKRVGFRVGTGNNAKFWFVEWVGKGPCLNYSLGYFWWCLVESLWVKHCYVGESGSVSWECCL